VTLPTGSPPPRPLPPLASSDRLPGGARVFRWRNFRLFWTGQLISLVGTWLQQIAQAWLVLLLTNDPLALGITAAAQFLPVIAFGLFGGVIADVLPKRATLIAANAAALLLALILGLLVATESIEVWHVYLLAALLGLVSAVEMPVRQAFVVEMIGREDVPNAIGFNSAAFNGARILGPAVAGLLIGGLGLVACFFINAASYLAVLASLVALRPAELLPAAHARLERSWVGVLGQLSEGLAYVRDTPSVRLAIIVLGTVATAAMNFGVLIPILARDVLGGGAATFGFLMAASGVGSLASALTIAFGSRPTLRRALIGAAVMGLALAGVGISRNLPLTLVLMVVVGWGGITMAASAHPSIQQTVPDQLRGRVMSVYVTVFAGSTPVGALLAGGLAATGGVSTALVVGGAVAILVAGLAATRLGSITRPGQAVRPSQSDPAR
jgi:MFS family permease